MANDVMVCDNYGLQNLGIYFYYLFDIILLFKLIN